MTKGGRRPFTIRLSEKQRIIVDEAIDYAIKKEKIKNRANALKHIMEKYLLGFNVEETPERIRSVFESIDCEFLTWEPPNFVCNETVAKKKKGSIIGSNPSYIIERCKACKKLRYNQRIKEENKFLRKDGVRKLTYFMNAFQKLVKEGLETNVYLCLKDVFSTGKFRISVDGVHIKCPLLNDEIVKISELCKRKVNPDTLIPPCEYLLTAPQKIPIKDTSFYGAIQKGIALPESSRKFIKSESRTV